MRHLAIITLLFSLFLMLLTWNQSFRLDTDYDSNFPIYDYIVDTIGTTHRLPWQNPLAGTGIPVAGDPLSAVWNPLLSLPILIFGTAEYGFRISIVLVIMLSSMAMWLLLQSLRVTFKVRMWGSLLYVVSGTLVARIAAGHIEKVLSYPLVPIFFLALLQKRGMLAGIVAAAAFLFGDVYLVWFFLVFWLAAFLWRWIVAKENFFELLFDVLKAIIAFCLVSAPKFLLFIKDVARVMERFFPVHFAEGSIHAFFTPLAFMVPWQTAFYDRPFFQRALGFHFNWYEYYAFVTPLPLVFLFQKKIWKGKIVWFLLFLLAVGALYVSLAFPYSPFYWIFRILPVLQIFRVPQRIFSPMTTIVIALFALAADGWFLQNKKRVWQRVGKMIMAGSLLWTSAVFVKTFIRSLEPPRTLEESVATELRNRDTSSFTLVNFVCCMQTFLIREKIGILNYYYGWRPKSAPNFVKSDGNGFDYSALHTAQPKYIIARAQESFAAYGYMPFFKQETIQVWKTL